MKSEQRPIPTDWRQTFREIVAAFAANDYQRSIPAVEPISIERANQIQRYIQDYGAALVALPEETWQSSVCILVGDHWDVLIDLWTKEEGRSYLVLEARLTDQPNFSVKVHLVYVP